jgi:U4/U6 small nuclear ribonucleoprotein PRP31
MSLADELLADLEDGDDFIDDTVMCSAANGGTSGSAANVEEVSFKLDTNRSAAISAESTIALSSIRQVARMIDSADLNRIIAEIKKRNQDETNDKTTIDGPVETHPEYRLIVDANNITVEIDDDIALIHKFVRDRYSKLLPELDSLIPNTLEYLMAVREIGNDLSNVKSNARLHDFLTQATIMVVNMTASTKRIEPLDSATLHSIHEACDAAIKLNSDKCTIFTFVESRMSLIAPNLSVIVGADIAAQLMGLAGGITNLSKMPACNVEVLGSRKRNLYGFSAHSITSHTGIVFHCDLVQSQPPDLRRKAARLVANKCTICARVDATHGSSDGSIGQTFRDKIEKALDKLKEPPPVKTNKALPAPIDQSRKKRGGKRVRRMKERMAMTEFRKQANRMNFAEIEDDAYQEDLGFSTGVIGRSGMGRIRAPQVDEKTKVRISKTLKKNMQKQAQVFGGSSTVKKHISGTASSVAFTPLQGLEIVNPHAAEATGSESSAKYFSSTSGFVSVIKRST